MKPIVKNGILAALVVGCSGAAFWFGYSARPASSESPTTTPSDAAAEAVTASVEVASLENGTIAQTIDAYGTIQAVQGSAISVVVPNDATVEHVLVSLGMKVTIGTPLVDLVSTPDAQLQLRQAKDALASADRVLEQVQQRLAEQLATNADLTSAEQAQQAAKTVLDSLQRRGVGEAKQLTATTTGIVTQIAAQPGQLATAGTSLMSINPSDGVEAIIGIEPHDLGSVKAGDQVELRDVTSADNAPTVFGTIKLLTPQINPQSRLRDVTVSLPNGSGLLQGTFVTGRLTVGKADGLIVPRSAVLPDDENHVLFTVKDGKAVRHVVKLGISNHERLQVVSDELHDGDTVVSSGNLELEDGMAVTTAGDDDEDHPATTAPTGDK